MHEKIKKRHEEIVDAQNTIWAMYKDFLSDHDMAEYNRKRVELIRKYKEKGDEQLANFCYGVIFNWTPIIMSFGEEFRMQDKNNHSNDK